MENKNRNRLTPVLSLLVALAACSDSRSPTTPSGDPPPSVFVLTGTVYEHTSSSVRPLADVPLYVSLYESSPPFHASDSEGRYRIEFPGWMSRSYVLQAVRPGYRQPCHTGITLKDEGNVLDLHVVAESVLAASGIPPSVPIVEPRISGRIVERTAHDDVPVRGARVFGQFGWTLRDDPLYGASTLSDASGRYLICGTAGATDVAVFADGFQDGRVTLTATGTQSLDITLVRK